MLLQPGPVSARVLARRALPWLGGFSRPIASVLGLALLLAALTAAAPLAVMRLVDALARSGGGQAPAGSGALAGVLGAPALVAALELLQVWLARLLEGRSWRVRLGLDFALRQRATARLHTLPLTWHQGRTVGATVNRVNTSINGFVTAVAPAKRWRWSARAAAARRRWCRCWNACTRRRPAASWWTARTSARARSNRCARRSAP